MIRRKQIIEREQFSRKLIIKKLIINEEQIIREIMVLDLHKISDQKEQVISRSKTNRLEELICQEVCSQRQDSKNQTIR
jgi:hypothetical protein